MIYPGELCTKYKARFYRYHNAIIYDSISLVPEMALRSLGQAEDNVVTTAYWRSRVDQMSGYLLTSQGFQLREVSSAVEVAVCGRITKRTDSASLYLKYENRKTARKQDENLPLNSCASRVTVLAGTPSIGPSACFLGNQKPNERNI